MFKSLSAVAAVLSMPQRLHPIQDALDLLDVSPVPKLDHRRFRRPDARIGAIFQLEVDSVRAQQIFDSSDFGWFDHDVRTAFRIDPDINPVTGKMIPHGTFLSDLKND